MSYASACQIQFAFPLNEDEINKMFLLQITDKLDENGVNNQEKDEIAEELGTLPRPIFLVSLM